MCATNLPFTFSSFSSFSLAFRIIFYCCLSHRRMALSIVWSNKIQHSVSRVVFTGASGENCIVSLLVSGCAHMENQCRNQHNERLNAMNSGKWIQSNRIALPREYASSVWRGWFLLYFAHLLYFLVFSQFLPRRSEHHSNIESFGTHMERLKKKKGREEKRKKERENEPRKCGVKMERTCR